MGGRGGGQSVLHYCSSDVILSFNRAVQTGQEKKKTLEDFTGGEPLKSSWRTQVDSAC